MFDATQVKLPYNCAVPYIGWSSVNDKMTSRVPYEITMYQCYKTFFSVTDAKSECLSTIFLGA